MAESDINLLRITPSNIVDADAELLNFNGDSGASLSLALDGSDTDQYSLTVNGTDIFIQYDTVSGAINITAQDGGVISAASLSALLSSATYENTSNTPTEGEGTDRVLTINVQDTTGLVSNDAVSTITVVAVNDAPIAVDDGTVGGRNRYGHIDHALQRYSREC